MPEPDPGREFLLAFTEYVDFRLAEKGEPKQEKDLPERLKRFVGLFEQFLQARVEFLASSVPEPNAKAFARMLEKMTKMKDGRGTDGPKP